MTKDSIMAEVKAKMEKIELEHRVQCTLTEKMLGSLLSFVHSTIDANDPKFLAVLKIKVSAMEEQFKLLSAAHQKTLLEATNAGLNESYIDKLIDDQISVSSSMTEQFAPVKALIKENNTDEANNDNACQNLQLKLPEIKLPSFSDNNENVFDYLNFKLLLIPSNYTIFFLLLLNLPC